MGVEAFPLAVQGTNTVTVTNVVVDCDPSLQERKVPGEHRALELAVFRGRQVRVKSSGREEVITLKFSAWKDKAREVMSRIKRGSVVNVVGHLKANDWQGRDGLTYGPIEIGIEDFNIIQLPS